MGLFITSIWAAFIDRLSVNQRLPIRWLLNGRKQEKQTFKVSKFEKINYWYCFLLNSVIHWEQLLPWAKRSSQNIWILINCKSSPSYLLQQLRNDKYFLQEIISQNVYTIVVNPHFGTLHFKIRYEMKICLFLARFLSNLPRLKRAILVFTRFSV